MIAGNEPTQIADEMAAAGMFDSDQLFCAAKDSGTVG